MQLTKPEPTPTATEPVIDIRDLSVHYGLGGTMLARLTGRDTGTVKAVDGISLSLREGEVVGLVGESGSGKSTLGRALLGMAPITHGTVVVDGTDVGRQRGKQLRLMRQHIQMVFQDPTAALNPGMTVEQAVGDPLRIHGMRNARERRERVVEALERVNLAPVDLFLPKYPRDLSGGQKQRVVLARAIIMGPSVLVADEPTSMLDMSVRAKMLQLMLDLKEQLGLTYIYITHDLATAKFFCERIAIMYLGRIVELGDTEEIFANPKHPYTKALLAAIPDPDPARKTGTELLRGEIPDAADPPAGCSFHPRCPVAFERCGWETRDLAAELESHWLRTKAETYDEERAKIGNLAELAGAGHSTTALLRPAGGATTTDLRALLDEMRQEKPDARLWTAVTSIDEQSDGVQVTFHEGSDPRLVHNGRTEVACHLFPADDAPEDLG